MNNILMGLETEYAFTPSDRDGNPLDRKQYSDMLVDLARHRYSVLEGCNPHDLFLSNGSRFYVDFGLGLINLEYSTPECPDPRTLIAHIRAGDRMLAGLCRELEFYQSELGSAFVSKTNVDYQGHSSGSHENYHHEGPQALFESQLLPHLVSRVIYSGGGGFNEDSGALEFSLSPRAAYLKHAASEGAQSERGVYTRKHEPLSRSAFGRLHLLCGDGLRYDVSELLRFGVTALIIRLVDAGLQPAAEIQIDSLSAIKKVAADVHCRRKIGRINGRRVSAIGIQRHYLKQVEDHIDSSILPSWATEICQYWTSILDALASDPLELVGILDWPTKLSLYRTLVEMKGYDWDQLTTEPNGNSTEIHENLYEADIRFGDIADNGLFCHIDGHDPCQKPVVDDEMIGTALFTPPRGSRAELRGAWIERLSHRQNHKRCNWEVIFDDHARRWLRFDDPFGLDRVDWQNR